MVVMWWYMWTKSCPADTQNFLCLRDSQFPVCHHVLSCWCSRIPCNSRISSRIIESLPTTQRHHPFQSNPQYLRTLFLFSFACSRSMDGVGVSFIMILFSSGPSWMSLVSSLVLSSTASSTYLSDWGNLTAWCIFTYLPGQRAQKYSQPCLTLPYISISTPWPLWFLHLPLHPPSSSPSQQQFTTPIQSRTSCLYCLVVKPRLSSNFTSSPSLSSKHQPTN